MVAWSEIEAYEASGWLYSGIHADGALRPARMIWLCACLSPSKPEAAA